MKKTNSNVVLLLLGLGVVVVLGVAYWLMLEPETSITTSENVTNEVRIVTTLDSNTIGTGIVMSINDPSVPAATKESASYNGKQTNDIYRMTEINKQELEKHIALGNKNTGDKRPLTLARIKDATLYVTCGARWESDAKPYVYEAVGSTQVIEGPFGGTIKGGGCNPFSIHAVDADGTVTLINEGAYN